MLSFSQNKLRVLVTETDAMRFWYFSYFTSTSFIKTTQVTLFYFVSLRGYRRGTQRNTPHHRYQLRWEWKGWWEWGGRELSLSDFLRTRSCSLSRASLCKMFHSTLHRYSKNSHNMNLTQPKWKTSTSFSWPSRGLLRSCVHSALPPSHTVLSVAPQSFLCHCFFCWACLPFQAPQNQGHWNGAWHAYVGWTK